MIKHRAFLFKFVRGKLFSSCPLQLDPQTTQFSSSAPKITHKDMCFSLAEELITRGLFSSAQKVIQRLINRCSTIPEAISTVDFAIARGMELDSVSYGCLIRKFVISGDARIAEALYNECVIGNGLKPDDLLLNSMIICYCKLGKLDEAKTCFDKFVESKNIPWVGSCNAIIKSFADQDRILDSYNLFSYISNASDEMVLNFTSYNVLVDKLCYKGYIDEGLHVFDEMTQRRVPPSPNSCKSLILGFCKWGRAVEAEILSSEFESHGFVMDKKLYTYLINAYCKGRKMKMAMRVFMKMLKIGYDPDSYTYNTLIHGFVNLGLFPKGWLLHNMMVNSGLEPNLVTYQIMLNKYCKARRIDCAFALLNDMIRSDMAPNVHCYTVLIDALCKEQRFREVYKLYHDMVDRGVVLDHVLFFTLVKNLPEGDELYLALAVLQAMTKEIEKPESWDDPTVEIERILDEIAGKNCSLAKTAYSIYIIALCMGGKDLDSALKCMEKAINLDFLPLPTAFNSLIKLLFHEGRIGDAQCLIELMRDKGLVPNQTAFSIMVNEYCKVNDFSSAIDLLDQIEEMGIKPCVAVYDSIIGCLGRQKNGF